MGITTARDSLTIHYSKQEILETIDVFANSPVEVARKKYKLGEDSRDWKVNLAQEDLKHSGLSQNNILPVLYRPFDNRYTYYTGKSRGFHCMP